MGQNNDLPTTAARESAGSSRTTNEPINEHINGQSNGHSNGYNNNHKDGFTSTANGCKSYVKGISEPIALCGIAMRLPGGIRCAEDFWDLLYNGKDARGPIPSDRYNSSGFNDALGKKDAIKTQYGYFLDEDLSTLDTSFFSLTKSELEKTDPQQRQILEVTRECFESAGEVGYRGKSIGCYVGTFGEDWLHTFAKEGQHHGGYVMSGHGDLMIANRVSFEYDLKGPSMVIKTACSASLVGLHEACRALQCGDCDGAIVAGTSLIMGPVTTSAMTSEGILSPEGSCKTFDASADGFARGESISAVYIKRLDDAIRDRNPVRGVIRGTATNTDGRSQGLMQPNGAAHEALMRKVYLDSDLDPRDTAFVECHGTGTATGDPIETTAVGNVFGEKGVYIGSVKPNVGHSEGASGISSLIKAVLALEKKIIPPNIKFKNPNPKIPFQEKRLVVPVVPTAWPADRAERVSINSFGIGGSNAHVILDSAPKIQPEMSCAHKEPANETAKLLVFSANTQGSLAKMIDNYQDYLKLHPERLKDLAYTLSMRREQLQYRAFSIITDSQVASTSTASKVPSSSPEISMIFSGQGAQWPTMGKDLLETLPTFREDIKTMDHLLQSLKYPPDWTIEDELRKPAETSQLHRAEIAQPLCSAVQIGLVNALERCGIRPSAVIGHSSGEIAAAYAAKALSLDEAMIVAYYRGYVTKKQTMVGGMAAVGLDTHEVSQFLQPGVVIACENSPNSTTISGDLDQVKMIIRTVQEQRPDVLARELKVDMAYHSHHMKALAREYVSLIKTEVKARHLVREDPKIFFVSSVTEKVIDRSTMLGPSYWEANLTSPVKFQSAVSRLLQYRSHDCLLEIGPHSTLAGPLRQICSKVQLPCNYIPTMIRSSQGWENLLSTLGQLFQQGINVAFTSFIQTCRTLPDLPAYPWEHSASYWYESRVSKDWRFRAFGHHAILGQRVSESTSLEPSWRCILDLEDEPWLHDHMVGDDIVFPFAGYVAMAGEAIRQVTGLESGYSVRHVVAHTALVLTDAKPAELFTTLRPHRLTDSSDSDGYDFVISSYSGSSWIKNCEGLVKPNEKTLLSSPKSDVLPRKVVVSRWYNAMARVGLVYGPEFQGITSISASTTEFLVAGEITNTKERQDAPYLFHPAAIDACFQLALAALVKGVGRDFTRLAVPVMIEELDISRSALLMDAKTWSTSDGKDIGIDCFADGKNLLRLRGIHLNPLDGEESAIVSDRHAAARLEWCPDFDFVDVRPLFKPPVSSNDVKQLLEELTLLSIIDSAERLKGLQTEQPHFIKFREWLNREVERAKSGTYPVIEDAADYINYPSQVRREMIQDRFRKVSTTSKNLVATGVMRICENVESLFTGKLDTLELLMEDDVLTEIYNAVSFGFSDFVRTLSNTKPNLRILEVGAGTGGTTELILRDLVVKDRNPPYSVYTFTDISAGFFPQAKERFTYAPNMDYKVFDISQNPFDQGFEAQSYDLILAPNVIHATASLNESLKSLQVLLRPHGHLVLSEVCAIVRAPGYVFGNFSGWWLGESDDRKWEPYVGVDRWDRELKAAGFSGVDTAVYDGEEPYQYCAGIVTQPKIDGLEYTAKSISVLCGQPREGISQALVNGIENAGYKVTIAKFGEPLPEDQDIISTLDLERCFFENITETDFLAFQDMLRRHKSQKLLWLMQPTQVRCQNPRSGQTIGMIRTVRAELALPYMTLEIDPAERDFSDLVLQVFKKACARDDIDNILPDREFAVDKGVVKIGRYQPFSLEQEVSSRLYTNSGKVKTLEIGKPGLLETLRWIEGSPSSTLPANHVEIETRAVGLNFRDMVYAMGVISFGDKTVPLGLELSGVVKRVGFGVENVVVGDRVFAFASGGCFTTNSILESPLVVKIPDDLSFDEAATMPGCYATAVQGLIDVGQLQQGQSVLIHSACGGVGHAAIQICKMIGAEIFATVGNERKVQYLINTFGIPRDHIFNSRDDSFYPDLMRKTDKRGVDIVLNSLSGELLHTSWRCVAKFGKMVELGKRDLTGYGRLDMETFLANRSYCCVDIAHAIAERPVMMGSVLKRCRDLYDEGHIGPIRPMTVFEATDVEQCFRFLQKGDHIGKAVVTMPRQPSDIPSIARSKPLQLDPEACYLLAGGLGGLGKSVVSWMVQRGARDFIFLSRSAGSTVEDKEFFVELETMGCSVCGVPGKVQDMQDLNRAILRATKPIKGVVHMAMVLRDAPTVDMTYEDWTTAVAPKVDGAWNLHKAFLDQPLDFFIMTSSLVTLVDQPGQPNYSAANTFLESFCQYRHTLGLAASVLSICPIDGVGFVAENVVARKKLKSQGLYFLPERGFLDYIELAILDSHPLTPDGSSSSPNTFVSSSHLVMGLRSETHLDDPNNHTSWRRDRRMGMYHNVKDIAIGDDSTSSNGLKNFLTRAANDPNLLNETSSRQYLAHEIGQKILNFMLKPDEEVNISISLTQIGLDSLMAIELRRWWKQAFGLDISVLEIMASGTLEELGKVAADGVRMKLMGDEAKTTHS
ncbi:MAG: hypothetical protein M1818_004298 [Claussenomyces sp. TS43310]|nr:MAG: hypothetical protein M1818_004298 [Claussenomyces sp. TS43310]